MNTEDIISIVMIAVAGVAVYTIAHIWLHII